jgi:hypothetical protein
MKKTILTGLILIFAQLLNAQISAVTETGEEVILYEDGTWKFLNDSNSILDDTIIAINKKEFIKNKNSTFLVKSKKLNIGIWINPKNWNFTKGTENDFYEFKFQKKGGDLFGVLIAEKTQIPIKNLKNIVVNSAKSASPDIKVVKEEYRNVNGMQVLLLQMSGTNQGYRFTYYGYYYSNANGTIQLLTYTAENLFPQFLGDMEEFLNGLVEY